MSLSQSKYHTQQLPPCPPPPSLPPISPSSIWPDAEGGGRWRLQAVGRLGVDTAEEIKQQGEVLSARSSEARGGHSRPRWG